MMNDDMELVRAYAIRQSEQAFETLVTRHVNLVYSSALRQTRDPHLAEEITQTVFIILARKANSLNEKTILPSWLHRTAGFATADALKIQRRRAQREQEAFMQSTLNEPEKETWEQIAPLLDAAIAGLNEKDRHAVVLRFFQNKSMDEIGAALGASEDAAKMRVNRALEKLRQYFSKRGVNSTAAMIAGMISTHSVHAAPVGLAKTISAAAITKGAAAGGSTLTLVKGALKIMAWTKAKTAIVAGVVVLLAAGTTTVIVKKAIPFTAASTYETIFTHPSSRSANLLESAPPTLIFRPTQFPKKDGSGYWTRSGKCVTVNFPLESLLGIAYGGFNLAHVILPDDFDLGNTNYDVLITLPNHQNETLQEELKKRFGLTAHVETRETDVLLLKIADPTKLQSYKTKGGGYRNYETDDRSAQKQIFRNVELAVVAQYVEVGKPVLEQTGSKEHYDFDFQWTEPRGLTTDAKMSALQDIWSKQLNQVGLELVPSREPVKMLVVEKAP